MRVAPLARSPPEEATAVEVKAGVSSGGGSGGTGGTAAGASGASGGAGGARPGTDAGADASCKKPGRVDLEIVLSQTASMNSTISGGGTLWTATTQAISSFVGASGSSGLGIGIQYFAVSGGTSDSCTASDYATPDVAVGTLPAAGSSIIASMSAHTLSTSNALALAIEGAVKATRRRLPSPIRTTPSASWC